MPPNRWIECECPHQKVDFDTDGFLPPDAMIDCPHCGEQHRAGDIGALAVDDGSGEVSYFYHWTEEDGA